MNATSHTNLDCIAIKTVINSDIQALCRLLDEGALSSTTKKKLMDTAVERNNLKIIKLLIKYGTEVYLPTVKKIFQLEKTQHIKKTVIDIITFSTTSKTVGSIFFELLKSDFYNELSNLEILKALLGHGIPINKSMYWPIGEGTYSYTPIQISILKNRVDYVLELLKSGADIHKNSKDNESCLEMALEYCDEVMVDLLLKNGADPNAVNHGYSILNKACKLNKPEIIYTLLKYGAHLSTSINSGGYYYYFGYEAQERFVKQVAILKFENQSICAKNLEYIQKNKNLYRLFRDCLNELRRIRNYEIHKDLTVYNVYKLRQNHKKLILLLKNEEFVKAFQSPRNLKRFRIFGKDLDNIFKMALKRRDILQTQMKKIHESGLVKEFSLPNEIIEMISYYACDLAFF